MTVAVKRPISVEVPAGSAIASPATSARVAVVAVTWNRKAMVERCIHAIAAQTHGASAIDLIVVDNGSTDGTVEHLTELFAPETIAENSTARAHKPDFKPRATGATNTLGLASLTIVCNSENHGGCGGFNTGFAYIASQLDTEARADAKPDYVWLVDDDAKPHERCLERLVRTASRDANIGLVGSRMVDMVDTDRTLETTVYFNHNNGLLQPHPTPDHPEYGTHMRWLRTTGWQTTGTGEFTGTRDVDVQPACSLLGRWELVKQIGFWDKRYFIYNDDGDWCLRFKKAGYRVVCDLDAIIYHEPWHAKLTPARLYYGQRNVIWLDQKLLKGRALRRVLFRRIGGLLRDGMYAATRGRLFHADLIRRTALDVVRGVDGKLAFAEPKKEPRLEAFERLGLLNDGATVAACINSDRALEAADELRDEVAARANEKGLGVGPRWSYIVRNDIRVDGSSSRKSDRVEHLVYSWRFRSKWLRRQLPLLASPPSAAVVFDQGNDFPLIRVGHNVHLDTRAPANIQVERGGIGRIAGYAVRWSLACVRVLPFVLRAKHTTHRGQFNDGA